MKTVFLGLVIALLFAFSAPEKGSSLSFNMVVENSKSSISNTSVCYEKGAKIFMETTMTRKSGKQTKTKSLINGDEQVMYMLDDYKKTATAMPFSTMGSGQPNPVPPQITETDEYKTIDGYKCRKTLVTSPKATDEYWATHDLNIDYSQVAKAFEGFNEPNSSGTQSLSGIGFPIKVIFTLKADGAVTTISYKDIKVGAVDGSKFDLSAYNK